MNLYLCKVYVSTSLLGPTEREALILAVKYNLDELQNPYRPWFWSFGQVVWEQTNKQTNKQTKKCCCREAFCTSPLSTQWVFWNLTYTWSPQYSAWISQIWPTQTSSRTFEQVQLPCSIHVSNFSIYREDWRSMFRSAFHLHKLEISMLVNLEKLAAMNLYLCYRFLFPWRQGYVRSMSMLVPPSWDHKI